METKNKGGIVDEEFVKKYTILIDLAICMENEIREKFSDLNINERRSAVFFKYQLLFTDKYASSLLEAAINLKLTEEYKEIIELFGTYKDEFWKLSYAFIIKECNENIKKLCETVRQPYFNNQNVVNQTLFIHEMIASLQMIVNTIRDGLKICKTKSSMIKLLKELAQRDESKSILNYFNENDLLKE